MSSEKVDVFVSGAGPIGLFFTYCMAMRGHTVYCIDPKPSPIDQSRAILVTARTMEVLESQGLAADILTESVILCGTRAHRDGVVIGQIHACGDTPYNYYTVIRQSKTEQVIYDRILKDTDHKIHWNHELVSYTQDDDKVVATIRNVQTGETKEIESKYIIGADGTHSAVRKGCSDWTYTGSTITTKFALADFYLKEDRLEDWTTRFNLFTTDEGALGLVRISPIHKQGEKTIFRVFGNLEAYERKVGDNGQITHGLRTKSDDAPITKEFVQEWMDRMCAPVKHEIGELVWTSYFRVNERIANGYRRGRAFLVGDSAHCHSPVGGQGLNTGLQDAFNLYWKLSNVLNNLVSDPEKLLDSYSSEREPIAKAVIKATGSTTEMVSSNNALLKAIRTVAMKCVLSVPFAREYAYTNLMQLRIAVDSQTSDIIGTSDKGLIGAGKFVPHCGLLKKSIIIRGEAPSTIQRYHLRDLFVRMDNYVAVFLGTCLSSSLPNLDLMNKFWVDTRKFPIKRIVIQSSWHVMETCVPMWVDENEEEEAKESFYTEEHIDRVDSVSNQIGLYPILASYFASSKPCSAVLIVRPDLYIAQAKLVRDEAELDAALGFFSSVFV